MGNKTNVIQIYACRNLANDGSELEKPILRRQRVGKTQLMTTACGKNLANDDSVWEKPSE